MKRKKKGKEEEAFIYPGASAPSLRGAFTAGRGINTAGFLLVAFFSLGRPFYKLLLPLLAGCSPIPGGEGKTFSLFFLLFPPAAGVLFFLA